jgi:hypothetical protein
MSEAGSVQSIVPYVQTWLPVRNGVTTLMTHVIV